MTIAETINSWCNGTIHTVQQRLNLRHNSAETTTNTSTQPAVVSNTNNNTTLQTDDKVNISSSGNAANVSSRSAVSSTDRWEKIWLVNFIFNDFLSAFPNILCMFSSNSSLSTDSIESEDDDQFSRTDTTDGGGRALNTSAGGSSTAR